MNVLFLLGLGSALHAQASVLRLEDDRAKVVEFAAIPQRVVSTLPSLTEIVCELGQCQRLVGVDTYSNWPQQVTRLPQVGGGIEPNIEAIVALKPDVVLMGSSSRAIARLENLGIKVLALEPKNHANMQRVMQKLGQLFALPEEQGAGRLWQSINAALDNAAQQMPAQARGLRVYYEVSSGNYAAGETSFIGENLKRLGAQNIIPASMGPFPKINPEFVVRSNPDVIMTSVRNSAGLAQRPGWSGMRALRDNRVCIFSVEESDILVRPGPRLADAAKILAKCLVSKAPNLKH